LLWAPEQAAVDRMLSAPPAGASSAEAQQQHLKLLLEAYRRTRALAEQLQVLSQDTLPPSPGPSCPQKP
jgi:hypothetical protein